MTIATQADRTCPVCATPIVRATYNGGRKEPLGLFSVRVFCSVPCRVKAQTGLKNQHTISEREKRIKARADGTLVERAGESVSWDPIIADRPTEDRCWAGFMVGRRCVLARGNHVTHRDSAGLEFVKLEQRQVESFERGAEDVREYFETRREWKSARGRQRGGA